MENAVEALKFAGAIMVFALALTISISSFSQANEAITAIVNLRDRETDYTYVTPADDLTRTVGVETVVASMYRAYRENIEIYFFDERTGTAKTLPLYYKTNNEGDRVMDNSYPVEVNYINSELENFGSTKDAVEHLDFLLKRNSPTYDGKYKEQIIHTEGLYEYLSGFKFKESFGEYYQGKESTKIKKRVITYTVQP